MGFWSRVTLCLYLILMQIREHRVLSSQTMVLFYALTMKSMIPFKNIYSLELNRWGWSKE